jgi:pilus assembly protein CpaF
LEVDVVSNRALVAIRRRFSKLRVPATNDVRLAVAVMHVAYPAGGLGMNSLNRILPFLRPIEDLLLDQTVTEVMVNSGGRCVFVEREGTLEFVPGRSLESRSLTAAIKNIARTCGDDVSEAQPILDARLEDGSRVAAMMPPCAVDGPILTVRKFTRRYALDDLVALGGVTQSTAEHLADAIATQRNLLISGGTGTGKTTLLNALAAKIPDSDRILIIEETSEIHLTKPNLVRCEARRQQMSLGQEAPLPPVTIADLLRAALRHRPDRILVGEVRGPEAWDLLQALNTGHLGSLSTIHANSAHQALTRFAHCVLMANIGLPHHSAREAIALAIHVVVHIARTDGRRRVTEVLAVRGYDVSEDRFICDRIGDGARAYAS